MLLVEDDPGVRRSVAATLFSAGYRLLLADSGVAALRELLSSGSPVDLILTDLHLPDMNGLDLLRRVERSRPGIRAIVMSADTGELDRTFADPPAHHVLPKPFGVQTLLRAAARALDVA